MASPPPITAVIFDLDGTLVQTRLASWEVFRAVSDTYRLGIREPEEFFALFDGNFYASLRQLCRDDQQSAEVKQAFIDSLGDNYRPWPVPGIAAVVRRMASVATLAVMSSNATPVIRRILTEHDLAFCISHVFGGDVIESKESAIRQFVSDPTFGPGRRCQGSYDESATPVVHEPGHTVLVTDTVGDVREATAAGIRAVGVTWGMHTAPDLLEAGAEFVALWPQEILSHLLGDQASQPAQGACALPDEKAANRPAAESVRYASESRKPAAAVDTPSAVRSQRSSARGGQYSSQRGARPERRPVGQVGQPASGTGARGVHTAQELEAAIALICAVTPAPSRRD
jgi:phosphoglycolate phosphatase